MKMKRLAVALLMTACVQVAHAQTPLSIITPNGGEQYTSGDIVPIVWMGGQAGEKVTIEFTRDQGMTWEMIDEDAQGGKMLWTIPALAMGETCQLRITRGTELDRPRFIHRFNGPGGIINSADISPDGMRMVVGGSAGVVKMWDMTTRQVVWEEQAHNGSIILARYSPDGETVATGSMDGTAKIFDAKTGELLHDFDPNKGIIWPATYSPNGRHLAVGSDEGSITIYDIATENVVRTMKPHSEAVRYLEYTKDGTRLMAGSTDGSGSVVNASTGAVVKRFQHAPVKTIANVIQVTHDDAVAITCGYDGWVRFWNYESKAMIAEKEYHGGERASEVQISPLGNLMSSVGYDGTVKLVDPYTGDVEMTIDTTLGGMVRSTFTDDGRFLAVTHFDGFTTLWQILGGESVVSDEWRIEVCAMEVSNIEAGEAVAPKRLNIR